MALTACAVARPSSAVMRASTVTNDGSAKSEGLHPAALNHSMHVWKSASADGAASAWRPCLALDLQARPRMSKSVSLL